MKGDTISRSALKEDIREWITNCLMCGEDRTPDILRIFIDLVDKQSKVAAAPEWISAKDGLPEDHAKDGQKQIKVLAAIKAKNGYTVRSQMRMKVVDKWEPEKTYRWKWKFSCGEVTHWMPLPQPPKDGGEGE